MAGWLAFAVSIMIKGPIVPAVLAVSVIAISLWDRNWSWLKTIHPIPGIILTLAICLPWGIAIAFVSHGDFYKQALGHDLAAKIMGGQESHGAPPGYYLALASLTLWPATLFAFPGIGNGIFNRTDPTMRYLLAWAGAAWLMFELVPTKLPHYILPAYPAVAFLGALWAMSPPVTDETGWARALRYLSAFQFFLGVAAFTIIPILAPQFFGDGLNWWLVAGAALGFAPGIAAVLFLLKRETMYAALSAVAAAVIFYPLIVWGVVPRVQDIWMSPHAAALVAKDKLPGDPPVVLGGYVEPSLVFLLGTDTEIQNGKNAAEVSAKTGGLALIEDKQLKQFDTRLRQLGGTARPVDEMRGFNYSRGMREHITVFRVTKAP
jgi:4-amino-4-deoxy-L-arabinose transferase-like glycosyltransferase